MKTCHILYGGHPLCGFSPGVLPGQWPAGHVWCSTLQVEEARAGEGIEVCPPCEEVLARRKSFKESPGGET